MKRLRLRVGAQVMPAARVAAAATIVIGLLYVALTVVFDLASSHHLLSEVDTHLSDRLSSASRGLGLRSTPRDVDDDHDIDDPPVVLWRVGQLGRVTALSDDAPALQAGSWSKTGRPTNATIGASSFRLEAIQSANGWLVAGQSLSDVQHVQGVLIAAEVIAGPVLVVAMFLGALLIGVKASGPVEQARKRQLEFSADASHELRTPLSVIQAELDLALASPRSESEYREVLRRVSRESGRLREIVDDLLWLARFDSEPPPPADEPVDVATIAEACGDRFRAIALAWNTELSFAHLGDDPCWVKAPPDWIDRLTGVLVDNACRYAGEAGTIRIAVTAHGNRVSLSVEDSGPGIPSEERAKLFDRFHRATAGGGGAGLGLAIADAVVRSTGGRWRVGDSPLGGASLEVSWHRFGSRGGGDNSGSRPLNADPTPLDTAKVATS